MVLSVDISAAIWAYQGLRGPQLRTFVDAFARLNGRYATEVLRRVCLAKGLPWPT